MNDYYQTPRLEIDDEFIYLKQPISDEAYAALERSILNDGCTEPILVWHGKIVDGIKRYRICTKYGIRIPIKHSPFKSKADVINYICKDQLLREDLVNEMNKYLIGRLYQAELDVKAQAYTHIGSRRNESSRPYIPGKVYKKREIAQDIADTLHISRGTVLKYEIFTKCIDSIREKEPAISQKILSGKLRISHENIIELERLPTKELKALNETLSKSNIDHITYSDIRHELIWKTLPSVPAPPTRQQEDPNLPIRQMPAYDPDSDLATLMYTVPTWVSSIKRAHSNTDYEKATETAKTRVLEELTILRKTIQEIVRASFKPCVAKLTAVLCTIKVCAVICDGSLYILILSEIGCNGIEFPGAIVFFGLLGVGAFPIPSRARPRIAGKRLLHSKDVIGILGKLGFTIAGLQNKLR